MGGDDNAVVLDLTRVPEDVAEIVFVLTMRLEDVESFGQLSYVGCRVFDDPRVCPDCRCIGNEQCVFEVICSQLYGSNAVYMSRIERIPRPKQPQKQPQQDVPQKSSVSASPPPVKTVLGGDSSGKPSVARSRLSATLPKGRKKRSFNLSVDDEGSSGSNQSPAIGSTTASPSAADGDSGTTAAAATAMNNEDDWKFVAVAEAIEGSTPAFAAYAVSVRAMPHVSRRQMIYQLGGAAEAQRSEDEKDMTDYVHGGTAVPRSVSYLSSIPLFSQSDKIAREAENDHYAGFVEYAIMRTISRNMSNERPLENARKRTLVAPPRLASRAGMAPPLRTSGVNKQSKERCTVM